MVYSATFVRSFRGLMDLEGYDLSNHPDDAGGMTKMGISKLAYPDEDIANLTVERVMQLYKRDWWDPLLLDSVYHEQTCFQLFESSVHMDPPGKPRRAVKIAQGALRIHGVHVLFDGIMGPATVGALNSYPHKPSLVKWMNILQGAALLVGSAGEDELIGLVKERVRQLETFGRGWGRRLTLE